jgi:C1A family cysteine protease
MADLRLKELQSGLWEAVATEAAALASADIRIRLGAEPPPGAAGLEERERLATQAAMQAAASPSPDLAAAAAPTAVDWRASGGHDYLGSIRDQASCGSCVAFGSIAAIEGSTRVAAKKFDLACDLSEAHLFYCHGASEGRNCGNGWWPSKALDAARSKGIVDEACFPYTAGDQACKPCTDAATRTTKIKSWTSLTTVPAMKTWIAEKGPVVACFTVYEDFRYYRAGVYHHVSGVQLGGHCVCIVGYSDADKCWIARNSWGAGWGESGYFRISYGEVGIDYEMWGVEVDAKPIDGAIVKIDKALITGLWVNEGATNAQCYVDRVGWRKLTTPAFVTAAAAARVAKAPCTLFVKGDTIVEMYVL